MGWTNTSKCEKCVHCNIKEISKAIIKVECKIRNKEYYFGQAIECDEMIEKATDGIGKEITTCRDT